MPAIATVGPIRDDPRMIVLLSATTSAMIGTAPAPACARKLLATGAAEASESFFAATTYELDAAAVLRSF